MEKPLLTTLLASKKKKIMDKNLKERCSVEGRASCMGDAKKYSPEMKDALQKPYLYNLG